MHAKTWLATLFVMQTVPALAWAQTANLPLPPAGFDQAKNGVPEGTVALINYQAR